MQLCLKPTIPPQRDGRARSVNTVTGRLGVYAHTWIGVTQVSLKSVLKQGSFKGTPIFSQGHWPLIKYVSECHRLLFEWKKEKGIGMGLSTVPPHLRAARVNVDWGPESFTPFLCKSHASGVLQLPARSNSSQLGSA